MYAKKKSPRFTSNYIARLEYWSVVIYIISQLSLCKLQSQKLQTRSTNNSPIIQLGVCQRVCNQREARSHMQYQEYKKANN